MRARFDALPAEARATLLQIERTTEIKLEIFADFLLQPTILADDEPSDDPRGGTRWSRRPGGQSERVGPGARSHDQKAEHGAVERRGSLASAHGAFVIDDATLEAISRQPYWVVKRFLDFVAALTLLVLLAPLFVVVGLLVVVDVGWPVTFWQQRPGLGNFSFKLYKFRTMAAAYDSRGERIADDERLSGIGIFLRRTRLDELPQLLHILAGKMSFVGPRPLLPVDQSSDHAVRLLVRPGMTGWAQVKGGRAISAEDKAALDVWYVNKASLALDLKIILDTIPMILVGERVDEDAIRQAWQDLAAEGICPPASMPPAYQLSSQTTSAGNPAP